MWNSRRSFNYWRVNEGGLKSRKGLMFFRMRFLRGTNCPSPPHRGVSRSKVVVLEGAARPVGRGSFLERGFEEDSFRNRR
jgi:hypothetical protein